MTLQGTPKISNVQSTALKLSHRLIVLLEQKICYKAIKNMSRMASV